MADKVSFELVAPERLLFSADIEMVVVPGGEGDFGVLAGHAPMISTVRAGVIEIHDEGKETEKIFVAGGCAEVSDNRCTVLAEDAVPVAELDRASLEQRIRNAEEDLEDAESDEQRHRLEGKLELLQGMLRALS
jgi:F-type H+-transporting ATPase subunit epsilon